MATRVCPQCKAQYVASVRRCIDCDLVLIDQAPPEAKVVPAVAEVVEQGPSDQIGYELEGWGNQLKVALEGMLDKSGIPRAWESGALVVPAVYEEEVDRLIATFEGADVEELPDEDAPQVAFAFEGLSPDELSDLDARLIADHIAHAWSDDAELLVSATDEDLVAALIDEVLEAAGEDEDDGLATQQALSELFVAVDKLQKDPEEHKLITRFVASAEQVGSLAIPYGLAGDDWQSLVDDVHALATVVSPGWDADEVEVDEVEADEVDDDVDAEVEEAGDAEADDDLVEVEVEVEEVEADEVEVEEADGEAGETEAVDADEDEDRARELARALRARLVDFV